MERVREAMEQALKQSWDQHGAVAAPDHGELVPVIPPVVPAVNGSSGDKTPATIVTPVPAPKTPPSGRRWQDVTSETLARNRLVAAIADSPEREAFCLLQATVSRHMKEHELRILGVTGPIRSRGKTLTAVNLAISLALKGSREVVLIDLDLDHPSIHERFELEPSAGVEGCLVDGIPVENVLVSPGIEHLSVLPSRGGSRHSHQILRSPNLPSLLNRLKQLYPDCVAIVDLPAVASPADGEAFGALVDATLVVAESGVTRESDYRKSVKYLEKSVLGTVLNKVHSKD